MDWIIDPEKMAGMLPVMGMDENISEAILGLRKWKMTMMETMGNTLS